MGKQIAGRDASLAARCLSAQRSGQRMLNHSGKSQDVWRDLLTANVRAAWLPRYWTTPVATPPGSASFPARSGLARLV
jgi:hypothetical protein